MAVRGLSGNNKLLILHDGVRIGAPAGEPIPVHENFPLRHLQQVEVVYGPGADAMKAVIKLVTANPNETTVHAAGGESDSWRAGFQTGGRQQDWRWRLAGHRQQSDGADLPEAYPAQFQFGDLRSFAGAVVVPQSDRQLYNNASDSESLSAALHTPIALELGFHASRQTTPTTAGDLPQSTDYGSDWTNRIETFYLRQQQHWDNAQQRTAVLDYSRYEVDKHSAFNNIFSRFQRAGWHTNPRWRP